MRPSPALVPLFPSLQLRASHGTALSHPPTRSLGKVLAFSGIEMTLLEVLAFRKEGWIVWDLYLFVFRQVAVFW